MSGRRHKHRTSKHKHRRLSIYDDDDIAEDYKMSSSSSESYQFSSASYESDPPTHRRKRKSKKKKKKKKKNKKSKVQITESVANRTRSHTKHAKGKAAKRAKPKSKIKRESSPLSFSELDDVTSDGSIEYLDVDKKTKKRLKQRKSAMLNRLDSLDPKYGLKYSSQMLNIDDVAPDPDFDATTYYPKQRPANNKKLEELRGKRLKNKTGQNYTPSYSRQDKSFTDNEKKIIIDTLTDIQENPAKYKMSTKYGWNSCFAGKVADVLWDVKKRDPVGWRGSPYRNTQSIALKFKGWESNETKEGVDKEWSSQFMNIKNKISAETKKIASDACEELNNLTQTVLEEKLKVATAKISQLRNDSNSAAGCDQGATILEQGVQQIAMLTATIQQQIEQQPVRNGNVIMNPTTTTHDIFTHTQRTALHDDIATESSDHPSDNDIIDEMSNKDLGSHTNSNYWMPSHPPEELFTLNDKQSNSPPLAIYQNTASNSNSNVDSPPRSPVADPDPAPSPSPSIESQCVEFELNTENPPSKVNKCENMDTKRVILTFVTEYTPCYDEDSDEVEKGREVIERILFDPIQASHICLKWEILKKMNLSQKEVMNGLIKSAKAAFDILK